MILDEIVQNSRRELALRKEAVPLDEIRKRALSMPSPRDMAKALKGAQVRIIAEVKRASPSRGIICADFNPVEIARTYARHNAAAISVLTETKYFQGSLDYLREIDRALGTSHPPLLRKDFIFDPYQVYESRAYGADAILLIVAILNPAELAELMDLSHRLQMKCLVEVHDEQEVKVAVASRAAIIGINNRDLKTFQVDTETTARLRRLVPADRLVVSESGIKDRADLQKLKNWGVNAALIGETLLASNNIGLKMQELQ